MSTVPQVATTRESAVTARPHGRLWIGNQTAFAAPHFLEPFQFALANGFEAFEWFPDRKTSGAGWDETDITASLATELREKAKGAGMRVSLHARWTANPLVPEGMAVLHRDIELAASLGASLLNLHLYPENGIDAYVTSLRPLLRSASQRGIQVSIENTVETAPAMFNELFARLKKLDPDCARAAGMCLDIGHANLCAETRNDYLSFVDRLEPHVPIIHLHLHENWGDADTHLPLFNGPSGGSLSGITGLLKRLLARNYSGAAILEQWPDPPGLLVQARARICELMQKLEQEVIKPNR